MFYFRNIQAISKRSLVVKNTNLLTIKTGSIVPREIAGQREIGNSVVVHVCVCVCECACVHFAFVHQCVCACMHACVCACGCMVCGVYECVCVCVCVCGCYLEGLTVGGERERVKFVSIVLWPITKGLPVRDQC